MRIARPNSADDNHRRRRFIRGTRSRPRLLKSKERRGIRIGIGSPILTRDQENRDARFATRNSVSWPLIEQNPFEPNAFP